MSEYIREHTPGSIVKGSLKIYFSNLFPILMVYFVPVIPFTILQVIAMEEQFAGLSMVAMLLGFIAALFAFAALTLLVSDICLGNKTSVIRDLKHVFGALVGRLLATNLMQMLAFVLCAVAFLIPLIGPLIAIVGMVVVLLWLMFCSIVVVLEGEWGFAALKRSKQLGAGKYWRNFGTLILMVLIILLIAIVLLVLVTVVFGESLSELHIAIFITIVQQLVMPLSLIPVVLLYYDLRARKEAFNLNALAEDLKY